MLEFLTSIIIFALSLGILNYPVNPAQIVSRIADHLSELEAPPANPTPENDSGLSDHTPNHPNHPNNSPDSNSQNDNHPDTSKIRAYNTSSGKVIDNVAAVAVENAPPLIACSEKPELCEPTPTPDPPSEALPTPPDLPGPIPLPDPPPPDPCIPPPPCVYEKFPCLVVMPPEGWCPPIPLPDPPKGPTPTPTPTIPIPTIIPIKPPEDCFIPHPPIPVDISNSSQKSILPCPIF